MTTQPLISLIAVHYNQPKVTGEFLQSLYGLTYENFEVIVVDNASNNNDSELFESIYPEVKYIRSDENLGFAGGNNLGIKEAKGDYLFLVNNDTELTPNILESLISTFNSAPGIGAVSPKIKYHFAPDILQYAGYERVSSLTGKNNVIGHKEEDQGQYDIACETCYAHGAGMMISRKVIEKVGLMPEDYFLYYEELDWCEQIRRNKFKIYYQPEAVLYHKESMTTGKLSKLKTYYLIRNRILFMRRNRNLGQLSLFLLYVIFVTIPKNTFSYLKQGEFEHLRAFYRGLGWNLRASNSVSFKAN